MGGEHWLELFTEALPIDKQFTINMEAPGRPPPTEDAPDQGHPTVSAPTGSKNWLKSVLGKEMGNNARHYQNIREKLYHHLVPEKTVVIKDVPHGCAFSIKFSPREGLLGITFRT